MTDIEGLQKCQDGDHNIRKDEDQYHQGLITTYMCIRCGKSWYEWKDERQEEL